MCWYEFGACVVLNGLLRTPSSLRSPCAAVGPGHLKAAPTAAAPARPIAEVFMNARRLRYTCFGVISELRILAMKSHRGVHPHFNRPTVLLRWAEPPLREGLDGDIVEVSSQ